MKVRYAVALFLTVGLVGCLPGETVEARYVDYDAAVAAGAIERGWIPLWLPEDAVDIFEKHNLDTNATVLRFDTPTPFVVPQECRLTATVEPATLDDTAWWPASIPPGVRTFACEGGYLSFDEPGVRIYYWRP